jgi:dihydrofolate reductase
VPRSMTSQNDAMIPLELTLIVAATRDMGIGKAGTLPWTGLRREMAYFARVTKRVPSDVRMRCWVSLLGKHC